MFKRNRQWLVMVGVLALTVACSTEPEAEQTPSAAAGDGEVAASTPVAVKISDAEVIVLGAPDDAMEWLKAENWWGEEKRGEQLQAPYAIMTGISPRWQTMAQKITVPAKKEVFYRFMLPLVLHANKMVLERRERLQGLQTQLLGGDSLIDDDYAWLRGVADILRIASADQSLENNATDLQPLIEAALYKLDVLPPGLVLGQAAYESGYGTSRFAVKGNALFGQWTYGGEGMKPQKQRASLGDHRIAAYDWPFDSVRGYYINISAHPAYEPLRKIRAERRAAGKPLDSIALADGLIRYSERGQAYVDTLKGIIRVNKLDIADGASLRDEPMRFLVSAESAAAAPELRDEIEGLRKSGELASIIDRMQLE